MADPTSDLREQAVEAVHARLHMDFLGVGGNPCGWTDPTARTMFCGPWRTAQAIIGASWPLAERAALDRAEKALRELGQAALRSPGIPEDLTEGAARGWNRAADAVASLRPEETP